jgi:acyl-CoA synthetase (AMP-forming)/AMP-acid ligase II/aryl carrier-like protein
LLLKGLRQMMTPRETADSTLSALLREYAERQPDATAILAPGRQPLSYVDLWGQVQRIADTLRSRGVTPTARVAVVLPNGPEMAATVLGVAAYAVCAPLNPAYRAEELRFYLKDTHAQFVVVDKGERGPVHVVAKEMNLTLLEVDSDATLAAGQFRFGSPSQGVVSARSPSASNDIALILHTSGTTARPKIVPLSQANLVASARNIARWLALQPSDRCLNVMPLFHIHGLVGALLASLVGGSSIVCTPGFDDKSFFDWVAQFEPSWYTAVPTIHQSVVRHGARYRQVAPHHRFRFVRSSSAALPPKTFESLRALTGVPVIESYGMTEASHQMASSPLVGPYKAGSVGVPAGVEMAVMDASGQLLPPDAGGEVVIRGPGVSTGYENNPEANATAFTDGWFRTGDLGRFDKDGYLYISGRLKEIINRGGEKVSPREIDEALLEHPDVAQAVAFPAPHPTLGEDVVAAVVKREGAGTDELTLRIFLINRLAGFKVPSRIVFVDAIPQGATGKVQRASLYDQLAPLLIKAFEPPCTEFECSLERIFREVLGCGPVGVQDNFFALGGDSLKGVQVMARIRTQHGLEIAVPKLFAYPTIATLALEVEASKVAADNATSALVSEIEQMSDDEVARLLSQEEGGACWIQR